MTDVNVDGLMCMEPGMVSTSSSSTFGLSNDIEQLKQPNDHDTDVRDIKSLSQEDETKHRLDEDEVEILEKGSKKNPRTSDQAERTYANDTGVDFTMIGVCSLSTSLKLTNKL